MHAAASNAVSADSLVTRIPLASGALPVGALMNPPTHRQLADGGPALTAVGHTIDQETARAAYTLAAIVLEGNRRLCALEQLLVERIDHLQK
ncbi:MAG: hypothetical protein JWM53_1622 [bacterium]|nr:hypothetical protein [bacterium]